MKIKKVLLIILCFAMAVTCLVGCKKEETVEEYAEYFNNFASTGAFTSATVTLTLSDGVTVSSYASKDDVYVTQKTYVIGEEEYVRYGFCSETEELLEPCYVSVVDIRGDYAIVVKAVAIGGSAGSYLGVVKFRGDFKGREYGFSYSYAPLVTQYRFLNDKYLSVMGSFDYTDDDLSKSSTGTYKYATIYDYTSAGGEGILEVGRIADISNESKFVLQDSVLAVMGTNIYYFYDVSKIENGGFSLLGKYVPYSEEDGYTSSYVSTDSYYIGNNWFVLSAYYTIADEAPDYYEMEVEDEDNDVVYYITIRSVRYNPVTNVSYNCDRVVLVANEYNYRYIKELTDSGNMDEFYYLEEDSPNFIHYYATPMVNVASIIKKGYSIAYYYYPILTTSGVTGSYTFCIMDAYCNIINLQDLLFPLVSVDGIAVQSPDPNFDMPFSAAVYFTLKPESITLDAIPEDEDGSDLAGYYITAPNDGMVLSYRYDMKKFVTMMGAYDVEKGELTVPYEYAEISVFVGGYAVGTQYEVIDAEEGTYKINYYRLDKNGNSTLLEDCVAMKNGVYMTKAADAVKYGLKGNDGTVLLENKYNTVSVVESFLEDGKFFKSAVFATETNPETGVSRGVIIKLK